MTTEDCALEYLMAGAGQPANVLCSWTDARTRSRIRSRAAVLSGVPQHEVVVRRIPTQPPALEVGSIRVRPANMQTRCATALSFAFVASAELTYCIETGCLAVS
jgi:hypothetical protein